MFGNAKTAALDRINTLTPHGGCKKGDSRVHPIVKVTNYGPISAKTFMAVGAGLLVYGGCKLLKELSQ